MAQIDLNVKQFQRELKELQKTWRILPAKIGDRVFRAAQAKGLLPVAQAVRKNLRAEANDEGHLAKSIGRANKFYRPSRVSWAGVGVRNIWYTSTKHKRNGRPLRKYPRNYAHLVEDGFIHKKSGRFVPGKRPFSRAWAAASPLARRLYLHALEARINKELKALPIVRRGRKRMLK